MTCVDLAPSISSPLDQSYPMSSSSIISSQEEPLSTTTLDQINVCDSHSCDVISSVPLTTPVINKKSSSIYSDNTTLQSKPQHSSEPQQLSTPQQQQPQPRTTLRNRQNFVLAFAFLLTFMMNAAFNWWITFSIWVIFMALPCTPPWLRILSQRMFGEVFSVSARFTLTLVEVICGVSFHEYGDVDQVEQHREENALLICNHPTYFDWLYIWSFVGRHGNLANLKIILKHSLLPIPWIGFIMQASMFTFLFRDWVADRNNFVNFIDYYRRYKQRYQILLFPEGAALGSHSLPRGQQFIAKMQMRPMSESLAPRTTGFIELFLQTTYLHHLLSPSVEHSSEQQQQQPTSLEELQTYVDRFSDIDAIYDLTLAYQNTRQMAQNMIYFGWVPSHVHLHVQRIPIGEVIAQIYAIHPIHSPTYYLSPQISRHHYVNYLRAVLHIPNATDKNANVVSPSSLSSSSSPSSPSSSQPLELSHAMDSLDTYHLNTLHISESALFSYKIGVWLTNLFYRKNAMLENYYAKLQNHADTCPAVNTPHHPLMFPLDQATVRTPSSQVFPSLPNLTTFAFDSFLCVYLCAICTYLIAFYSFPCRNFITFSAVHIGLFTILRLPLWFWQINSAKAFDYYTNGRWNIVLQFELALARFSNQIRSQAFRSSPSSRAELLASIPSRRHQRLRSIGISPSSQPEQQTQDYAATGGFHNTLGRCWVISILIGLTVYAIYQSNRNTFYQFATDYLSSPIDL